MSNTNPQLEWREKLTGDEVSALGFTYVAKGDERFGALGIKWNHLFEREHWYNEFNGVEEAKKQAQDHHDFILAEIEKAVEEKNSIIVAKDAVVEQRTAEANLAVELVKTKDAEIAKVKEERDWRITKEKAMTTKPKSNPIHPPKNFGKDVISLAMEKRSDLVSRAEVARAITLSFKKITLADYLTVYQFRKHILAKINKLERKP